MTVSVSLQGLILLTGACPIEDAETLLLRLEEHPGAAVDWSNCGPAHTAVIQVLMAAGRPLVGYPTDEFLRRHIASPATASSGAAFP